MKHKLLKATILTGIIVPVATLISCKTSEEDEPVDPTDESVELSGEVKETNSKITKTEFDDTYLNVYISTSKGIDVTTVETIIDGQHTSIPEGSWGIEKYDNNGDTFNWLVWVKKEFAQNCDSLSIKIKKISLLIVDCGEYSPMYEDIGVSDTWYQWEISTLSRTMTVKEVQDIDHNTLPITTGYTFVQTGYLPSIKYTLSVNLKYADVVYLYGELSK